MIIDCGTCTARGAACANCVVPRVTGTVTFVTGVELDAAETRALAALADADLIPPLRYAPPLAKAS
jgi:hypothetical protein